MHVIAAKAVAFKEALSPAFKSYQRQVVVNARAMAGEAVLEIAFPLGGAHHQFMVAEDRVHV